MNRKPSEFALVAVSLLCILILVACGNSTPTLQYILISPTTSTIGVGTTQQFTATGYYSNGSTATGFSVTWGSSTPAVATIDATGVATGVALGTTTITATALGVTATSATLNVNQLTSIAVTPANPTIAAGNTEQFAAVGTYQNPGGTTSTSDITAQVTWTSGTLAVATLSSTTPGLATGLIAGTSVITAALDGVSGTTTLTVGAPVPVSLVITPPSPTVAIDNSVAFTAQEKWSDGTLHTPAGPASWTSATTTTATILADTGQATGLTAGTSVITATENTFTATATLTVVVGSSHYAYVSNNLDNTIQWYSVSPTTSPYLTSQGTFQASGPGPTQTVIHPSGQYVYYTDDNSSVWVTTINSSTGALTSTAFSGKVAGSGNANFAIIDPYGRFLYVSDDGGGTGGTITGFTISQTDGSLTPISLSPSPFTTNLSAPECLIIDHTGTYLYAINQLSSAISAYAIDQTSGALTPLSTPTFPTGNGPYLGGLDPSGTHLYVANSLANTISGFSIGTGGVLSSVGADTTVTGATYLENMVVDPSGTHIYALDQGTTTGQVFGFNIGSGGVIGSAISGTPVATGDTPFGGIVIDRTGALLAVENNYSNTISLYTIGSGGALTPDTPVNTGTSPFFVTLYNAP